MAENLASKYRPRKLEDMTEQSVVVDIVKNMCESEDLKSRNFLFIGPAGCGKTTTARIICNMLNEGVGDPIEIDAASNSGVDSIRTIIDQARTYPVGSKYKIFILDECFPSDSLVSTPSGLRRIQDIQKGDVVYNLTGQAEVADVFRNRVRTSHLAAVKTSNGSVVTTKDHLFFTDRGWVPASELIEGDNLYDTKTLQAMRKTIQRELPERSEDLMQFRVQEDVGSEQTQGHTYKFISQTVSDMWKELLDTKECECNNMLSKVWDYLEIAESRYGEVVGATCKTLAYIYMSCMRETDGDTEQRSSDFLQLKLLDENGQRGSAPTSSDKCLRMVWEFILSSLGKPITEDLLSRMQSSFDSLQTTGEAGRNVIREDEIQQSNVEPRNYSEDAISQREEWYITQSSCIAWWKRTLHEAPDDSEEFIRRSVDIRISRSNESFSDRQPEPLSYELQTRPSLSRNASRSRSGWCRAQSEIATVVRCQKDGLSSRVRVEGVEIYKRGDNDELFRSSFSDRELSEEYVTMYDLEIDGHPSYFVEDLLVHNCHALSQAAWQALLKTLEEQPAKSVFALCTTNPEKIPPTITSRVQTFQLSKISLKGIHDRLVYILEKEKEEGRNITYTEDAVNYISKMARGGMRDAITLLEKALSYSNDITIESIEKSLGLPKYDDFFKLLNAIAKKDNDTIIHIINDVYNTGLNFTKWFEEFFSFTANIVKYIYMQDINETMIPSTYADKISGYNTKHSAFCLRLSNKLSDMINELKRSQYLQEVAISYLCS